MLLNALTVNKCGKEVAAVLVWDALRLAHPGHVPRKHHQQHARPEHQLIGDHLLGAAQVHAIVRGPTQVASRQWFMPAKKALGLVGRVDWYAFMQDMTAKEYALCNAHPLHMHSA